MSMFDENITSCRRSDAEQRRGQRIHYVLFVRSEGLLDMVTPP
jgi:hypothetical protein